MTQRMAARRREAAGFNEAPHTLGVLQRSASHSRRKNRSNMNSSFSRILLLSPRERGTHGRLGGALETRQPLSIRRTYLGRRGAPARLAHVARLVRECGPADNRRKPSIDCSSNDGATDCSIFSEGNDMPEALPDPPSVDSVLFHFLLLHQHEEAVLLKHFLALTHMCATGH